MSEKPPLPPPYWLGDHDGKDASPSRCLAVFPGWGRCVGLRDHSGKHRIGDSWHSFEKQFDLEETKP